MNKDELIGRLARDEAEDIARSFVLNGVPELFANSKEAYSEFRDSVARLLHVDAEAVRIVGSARCGYSMSPETFGAPFTFASDVDVVVVDADQFDQIWWVLSKWAFPCPNRSWPKDLQYWARGRAESCFNGWLEPTEFRMRQQGVFITPPPLRDIRVAWFNAMKELSRLQTVAGHDCEIRLYRSWDHAHRYHAWSLQRVRAITTQREG